MKSYKVHLTSFLCFVAKNKVKKSKNRKMLFYARNILFACEKKELLPKHLILNNTLPKYKVHTLRESFAYEVKYNIFIILLKRQKATTKSFKRCSSVNGFSYTIGAEWSCLDVPHSRALCMNSRSHNAHTHKLHLSFYQKTNPQIV